MRRDELRALGRLAGESAGGLTGRIHQTHRAVARRGFAAAGAGARPVEAIHDAIAAGVYGAVGLAGRHGLHAAGALAAAAVPAHRPGLAHGDGGRDALAALNGLAGDRLYAQRSVLSLRTAIVGEIGEPTPRVAVFLHGLGQSEAAWRDGPREGPIGRLLRERLGITAVYVRYNSGRPVDEVGPEVAALLERLVGEWPLEVTEITLVGHAIGALVAEAAFAAGGSWTARINGLVAIGAPYGGLTVGNALRGASRALARLPETRAVAGLLEARSAGLKQSETGLAAAAPAGLRRLHVSGSIARDPAGRAARVLGDLVVSRDSAWAHDGGSLSGAPEDYRQVGGASHFVLPRHPAVAELVARWLSAERAFPALAPGAAQRP